jgi:hypothetical protein
MGNVFDLENLFDLIDDLKSQKRSLESEKSRLKQSVESLEQDAERLKKEFNVAGALDLVKFYQAEENARKDSVAAAGVGDVSQTSIKRIDDKKFVEANTKLEVKILNAEMNAILPSLEVDALALERKLGKMKVLIKDARKKEDGIPVYMMNSSEELNKEADAARDAKFEMKAKIRGDVEDALQRKVVLRSEISYLRQKVDQVIDEEWIMERSMSNLKLALACEEGRAGVLRSKHSSMRHELFPTARGSNGWATHAFSDYADLNKKIIAYTDIPRAILPWVASDAQIVMQLGGPRGALSDFSLPSGNNGGLDEMTLLEESGESMASRGAESCLLKYMSKRAQTDKISGNGSTQVNPFGLDHDTFVDFCGWIEESPAME